MTSVVREGERVGPGVNVSRCQASVDAGHSGNWL